MPHAVEICGTWPAPFSRGRRAGVGRACEERARALPQIANMSSSTLNGINDDAVSRSDSIQRIAINLKEQEINIRLEGLPPLKLNLLKQILKSEELNFIESDLIEKDEGFFGNLLVQYET